MQRTDEQDWKQYTFALLLFSLVSCLFTYAILRRQNVLPLNPQGLGPVSPDLAFNTAVSFTTNTNWQSYAGESTMSYASTSRISGTRSNRIPTITILSKPNPGLATDF